MALDVPGAEPHCQGYEARDGCRLSVDAYAAEAVATGAEPFLMPATRRVTSDQRDLLGRGSGGINAAAA